MKEKTFTNSEDVAIIPPTSLELGEYHLGLLSKEKAAKVEKYLKQFPYAKEELNRLRAYLNEPNVEQVQRLEADSRSQLKILLAKLTGRKWALPGGYNPQFMPSDLRGLEEGVYETNDICMTLGVRDDEKQPGYKVLTGVIDAQDDIIKAFLWRKNSPTMIASTKVEDNYEFEFSQLEPGDYELILTGPNVEVHIQDITF